MVYQDLFGRCQRRERRGVGAVGGSRLLALLVAGLAAGCASAPAHRVVPLEPVALSHADLLAPEHTLAVGDVLFLQFPHRPEYDRSVPVRTDGRISLPELGVLEAAGKTPEVVEAEARAAYRLRSNGPPTNGGDRRYVLSVGDQVDLRFRLAADLNTSVVVRPDGRISLDLVESVVAEGKSPEQLQAELRDRYAAHLRNPDLVVVVREFSNRRAYVDGRLIRTGQQDLDEISVTVQSFTPRQVFIAGEVRAPGFVTYQPPMTALQAIASVGGVPRGADLSRVLILRKIGTETPTATYVNLATDLQGLGTNDLALRPFDIVIVPKTRIARAGDFLDQYLYQLVPATRNVNFTYFYNLGDLRR